MDNTEDRLLSREEAAKFLGVTPGTLTVWASTRRYNLSYVKVGSLPKYKLSSLREFVKERTVGGQNGR